ncbi:hypothetical protein QM008_03010 [Bifidobacterium angulatum]
MNKSKLFASIKRGFTFAGMNALASAGYSKSIVDAIKQMKDIK